MESIPPLVKKGSRKSLTAFFGISIHFKISPYNKQNYKKYCLIIFFTKKQIINLIVFFSLIKNLIFAL